MSHKNKHMSSPQKAKSWKVTESRPEAQRGVFRELPVNFNLYFQILDLSVNHMDDTEHLQDSYAPPPPPRLVFLTQRLEPAAQLPSCLGD